MILKYVTYLRDNSSKNILYFFFIILNDVDNRITYK